MVECLEQSEVDPSLRFVNPDRMGNRPVQEVDITDKGTVVHLKGYGFVKVFKIVVSNGDIDYWATNDLGMGEYHRGLKQCCGAERAQVRSSRAQGIMWA